MQFPRTRRAFADKALRHSGKMPIIPGMTSDDPDPHGGGALYVLHAILALGMEIAVLVGLWQAGRHVASGWQGYALAALALAVALALWARWGAPTSPHRLRETALLAFKSAIFTAGALAWAIAAGSGAAMIFAVLAALHLALALWQGWL